MFARVKALVHNLKNLFRDRERNVLMGLGLTISGLFLPWINILSYYSYGNSFRTRVDSSIIGYSTTAGRAILIIALIYLVTVFLDLKVIRNGRTLRKFLSATAGLLAIIVVLGTGLERVQSQSPSPSIVVSLVGLLLLARATFQETDDSW